MIDLNPEYQDEVKHKKNDMVGVVIAKYVEGNVIYLDVRGYDDRIYYRTPMSNWEVVRLRATIEE